MRRQSEKIVITDLIKRVDEAYAQRANHERVHQSIELLRQSKDVETEFELAWRLGRAHFFIGQQLSEAEEMNEAFNSHRDGFKACAKAVIAQRARVEGHFWLGVNLALAAQARRSLAAVSMTLRARNSLTRAIEIDESYHAAGPLRVLARWHHKAPRVLGARLKLAYRNYERALAIAPDNTVTRLYFAELLFEQHERERAREELEAVLAVSPDEWWEFETKRDQAIATTMLSQIKLPTT